MQDEELFVGYPEMKYKVCYIKTRKETDCLYVVSNSDLEIFFLNQIAFQVLMYIKNGLEKNEIIDELRKIYLVNIDSLKNDVEQTILYLEKNNLITKGNDKNE